MKDEPLDALFVQSGAGFSSGDGTITLHAPAPATVFFVDHPRREAGHVPTVRFADLWAAGGFTPTAVVSFVEDGGPADAVVVLLAAQVDGDALTYTVELVDGRLPVEAGPCTLFIDALEQPLASVPAKRVRRR